MIQLKKTSILLLLFVLIFNINTACSQSCGDASLWQTVSIVGEGGVCDDTPWVLTFEDDFNGTSLDLTKWGIPYQGMTRDYGHNDQKQWNVNTGTTPSMPMSNNITVSNGTLKLIAKKEIPAVYGTIVTDWSVTPPATRSDYYDYSSAEIFTTRKFGYGKYEIRCKIPKGKGFWPAFWTYSGTTRWNEIDVFEFWNENNCFGNYDSDRLSKNPHFNNYYDYDNNGSGTNCGDDMYGPCSTWNGPDFSADFHTFTMIYDRYKIEWYVDGVLKRRVTQFRNMLGGSVDCSSMPTPQNYQVNKTFPRAGDFNIIVNLAIQAGGGAPDANTPFPSNYEIDYIRYYKQAPCTGQVYANTTPALNLHSTIFNVIVGTSINLGGTAAVNGNQLDLIARDAIHLNPGFTAENSDFLAKIDLSVCSGVPGMVVAEPLPVKSEIEYVLVPSSGNTLGAANAGDADFDVKMYPNPTKDILNIVVREEVAGKYSITLSDMNGTVLINSIPLGNDKTNIDLSVYPAGTYNIQIIDAESKKMYVNTIIRE